MEYFTLIIYIAISIGVAGAKYHQGVRDKESISNYLTWGFVCAVLWPFVLGGKIGEIDLD